MIKFTLPLVDINETDKSIDLTFLDEIAQETHTVTWNKGKFNRDTNQWETDEEKEAQVGEWCKQYLNVPIEEIETALNNEFTIYSYPTFDSMWMVASKFPPDMKGQIIQAEIDRVEKTPTAILIWYMFEGDLYVARMRHERTIGDKVYTDSTKRNKRYAEFNQKFGVTVDEAVEGALKDRVINVLVKSFGKNTFGEIQSIVRPR